MLYVFWVDLTMIYPDFPKSDWEVGYMKRNKLTMSLVPHLQVKFILFSQCFKFGGSNNQPGWTIDYCY